MNKKEYIRKIKDLTFVNRAKAIKDTGLSYLGNVNISAKIKKNKKERYFTYIIYLSPANSSGYNVCPKASKGCINGCLNTSGRVKIDTKNLILDSRLKKTLLFFNNREFFVSWLFAEIEANKAKAERKGFKFSVRLNGTSDISPEIMKSGNLNVLQKFSDIQFYDYTKVFNRLDLCTKYPNYYLTFSYSEVNVLECFAALDKGFNVAIPFYKTLPKKYFNTEVINGDTTDLRFLDEKNKIVGLTVKKLKDKKAEKKALDSGFFVNI